ncbi:hypothetical protein CORC01_01253 [Colletotrichum orchidophilum]|uniref:Uncharacterized protein n=1 Tax=Colletotrichum orchidophilum TaxID=1209926 RepID=A0A1G4BQ28_9PEZI|nr:uncharacterized protein CORC01_01253 [Colletotrichum orchidophilum]OHF03534.1 hypothetical protein CORC01_01253 [Colletotrichum orchidophilum]
MKDTMACLPSQLPFRKAGDDREWVNIIPFCPGYPRPKTSYANGIPYMDFWENDIRAFAYEPVQIPSSYLSVKILVIQDFVPGVAEHDALIAQHPPGVVGMFFCGDMVTHEAFSAHPPEILRVRGPGRAVGGHNGQVMGPRLIPLHFVRYGIPPGQRIRTIGPKL